MPMQNFQLTILQSGSKLKKSPAPWLLFSTPLLVFSFAFLTPSLLSPLSLLPEIAQARQSQSNEALRLNQEGLQFLGTRQYQQALEKFQQALAIVQKVGDRSSEGVLLNNLGRAYQGLSQFPKAMELYQQALTIHKQVKNRPEEGNTLGNIGELYTLLGQYPKALEFYQQALTIHKQLGDRLETGKILNNIGEVYYSLGQYPKALEFHQQSLAVARGLGNSPNTLEGSILNNLGKAYYNLGQYPKALEFYQQGLAIHKQLGNRPMEGSVLANIGVVYKTLGQYPKALESLQQGLAIFKQVKDRHGEGTTLNNIGNVYSILGQYPKALEFYQQALPIAKEVGDRYLEAAILNNIGDAYRDLGQYPKALEFFRQALAIMRALGNRPAEGAILSNIGFLSYNLKQFSEALEAFQQSLTLAQQSADRSGEVRGWTNVAAAYQSLGQHSKVVESLQRALVIVRELGDRPNEATILSNIGAVLLRAGKAAAAEQPLLDAIAIWESLRPGLSDANKVSLFDTQAITYNALQKSLVAQNKTEAALQVAERGRARAFVELLARRQSQGNQDQATVKPPNIAQIQQIAKAQNATLVQYSVIRSATDAEPALRDSDLYIWVIKPTGEIAFRQVDLRPTLQKDKLSLADYVQQNRFNALGVRGLGVTPKATTAQPTTQLQALHQLLIAPIQDLLPKDPNQRVIFVPQSALFLVPFPALQDANKQHLIEKHTILTAPSIQVLELTRKVRSAQRGVRSDHANSLLLTPHSSLIVGNPTMPKVVLVPGEPAEQLASLPGSEKEAKAIAEFLKAPTLIGAQATEATVRQRMPQATLIHLATHGLFDDQRGLGSSIALAPDGKHDGLLSAEEILDLQLQAELVVLSACDTGRGKITGDGVIGLSRSLFSAGVPSVIVSLWAVPDAPTAELMTEFYRQLQQQPDKAQALRQAMLATKAKYPNPTAWAAFTLIGEAQ